MRPPSLRAAVLCLAAVLAAPLQAATPDEVADLARLMRTDEMIAILRDEGLVEADEIGAEMFPGRLPASWSSRIGEIYEPGRVEAMFVPALAEGLAETDITPLIDFFGGPTGAEIITLELTGRRAFISDDVERAARDAWEDQVTADDARPRVEQIRAFIDVNDLLERNVAGALNSSLAFYQGLATGELFEMTESEILSDVWAQEAEIRTDTDGWLTAYLGMSYEPLPDAALDDYIALSRTEAGQDLNRALFEAFDLVFEDISFRLGAAIAELSSGEEL